MHSYSYFVVIFEFSSYSVSHRDERKTLGALLFSDKNSGRIYIQIVIHKKINTVCCMHACSEMEGKFFVCGEP
jgi:sulfite reductase alpha subunit-like flavoprotein